ncbi:hypothetical protein ASZ90_015221 [hydrocarbon metagenome]|uniref:Uncharacterized protein n=1 Tax=hydrocarbon metagenome TaxID=938273 RepID=A0A0W8F2K2_9ZZZZ
MHLPLGRQQNEGSVLRCPVHGNRVRSWRRRVISVPTYGVGEYRFRVYGRYAAGETMYAG